ncbi:MAG: hypothetical protein LBK73_00050 [Treponema sp.]|jgi:hypothetical protein|nr:hypothetical protein [Treponema sp.]
MKKTYYLNSRNAITMRVIDELGGGAPPPPPRPSGESETGGGELSGE